MNAKEARAITDEIQSLDGDYKKVETDAILTSIKFAASRGESSINVYLAEQFNFPIIIERLKRLDFLVFVTDTQRDGWTMTVTW